MIVDGNKIDSSLISDLRIYKRFLVVRTFVGYKDTYGNDHKTSMCHYYAVDSDNFPVCAAGFEAN